MGARVQPVRHRRSRRLVYRPQDVHACARRCLLRRIDLLPVEANRHSEDSGVDHAPCMRPSRLLKLVDNEGAHALRRQTHRLPSHSQLKMWLHLPLFSARARRHLEW